ncbi:MAG: ABC transporter permease, partial [Cyclobacteriaceae bacterium]
YDFKPLTDVHLETVIGGKQTLKSRLKILLFIGFLIFSIACINYTNLSTIQIITRAKEVGIKKVTGSSISRLFLNAYLETTLIVLLALFLGGLLMVWALPYFNDLTGRALSLHFFNNPLLLYGFPVALIVATLVAGTYPAAKLAKISPTTAFKGLIPQKSRSFSFRNALIIGQFVVCIAMICITLLFSKQISYISSQHLGFDPDQILVIKDAFLAETAPFKQAVLNIPYVETASYSNTIPGRHYNDQGIHIKGTAPSSQHAHVFKGDYELKNIFNLELVSGRWFSEDIEKDKATCILNETAIKTLNIEDPLNTILDDGSWSYDSVDEVRIIGVVKDFNFKSLQWPIEAMQIYPRSEEQFYDGQFLTLQIAQTDYQQVITQVKAIWDQQTGNLPFEYFFLDQDFNKNYQEEAQLRKIFLWFSLLAIFVTCLGLLGLSSFLILRRTKEIGIRKVNGANVPQIIRMLNYDFIKLVIIALAIATPVAYLVTSRWLESFAYKTSLSWWVFALAGASAILIALFTVSWQSWKAAVRNPVDALRYE